MTKIKPSTPISSGSPDKRVALYARVSSEEQTRGNYPSCTSQVEELEAACRARGWQAYRVIKDEGFSAGSLKRPGLSELRWLVQNGEIDGIACTWYDRLTRSRDFYTLDREFKEHQVEFITLHDPTDRHTASGRFLETMLVAAKTYEREQTGEKVRTKMQMRAEKGMWNGGRVPFGFRYEAETQRLLPREDQLPLIEQVFQVYVDTRSDFAVRDWLRAHNVPAYRGKSEWTPTSVREMLSNRRYIAEVEINRHNRGVAGLPEFDAYRVIAAAYEPLVSRELFETAQAIRRERAAQSPHRGGKGKGQSYSRNQCGRVYLLQSNMVCGICGAAMSPHYVFHKAGGKEKRRKDSYIYHYTCAEKMKYRQAVAHSNRVLARVAESWILDAVENIVTSDEIMREALDAARARSEADLQPTSRLLSGNQSALRENQRAIDELVATASNARGALLDLLAEKAHELKMERERLHTEQRRLTELLTPLDTSFDDGVFRKVLGDFSIIREHADPEELQRMLRLVVRQVAWMPEGNHRVDYWLPVSAKREGGGKNGKGGSGPPEPEWFEPAKVRGAKPHVSF
jgi:DNA invertase Pin-like site-specific DNA recombinase